MRWLKAINTEAGLPDGCGFIYNNASLDSEATGCDYRDISIKKFVEMRRETLYQGARKRLLKVQVGSWFLAEEFKFYLSLMH